MQAKVTVDKHLADQLLLPLILGKGGRFTTTEPSPHLLTNIFVVEQFMGSRVVLSKVNDSAWELVVQPPESMA